MARTKYQQDRCSGRMTGTNIAEKLQDIVADIKERGRANLTRLTVLKKWFEAPGRTMSFGAFIAIEALPQTGKTTKEAEELLCEARQILADVDLFAPKIPNDRAKRLRARLEAFQDERRNTQWASVRIIHNRKLFFVESGLGLYLWYRNSPSQAYQLAASYCEHYDPRYGNGLNGPSAKRIQEIAGFTLAMETHESGEHAPERQLAASSSAPRQQAGRRPVTLQRRDAGGLQSQRIACALDGNGRAYRKPVGGEILVKRGSESEIDSGNVAAKCNKQARQAPPRIRQRIARAVCHRASGERDGHCNSPYIRSACAPGRRHSRRTHGQDTLAGSSRFSRSTNGWETGANGMDLSCSTSITRRLASQR